MAQTKLAMSKREFCEQFGIGNTLFYKMLKTGEGPKLMRCGGRILVATDTALAWMRSREEAAKPTKPARTKATKLPAAGGAPPVAPAPVLATQDVTPAARPGSIEENTAPRLAASRRTDSTYSHSSVGGMPRRKAW